MKYFSRLGIYKCSNGNCTLNPKTLDAYSYKWWRFVALVDGKVIFNNYRYSNSTSKHQSKVRQVLKDLGIKIDIEGPFAEGIGHDSLESLILQAEEGLCDAILVQEMKRDTRNQKAKRNRLKKALINKLENEKHFRDYDIELASRFGHNNKVAVHQVVEAETLEQDVENAIYNFQRDGFGSIVFYI